MQTSDPAYFLLMDAVTSTPKVYRDSCYICRDPEFAQMGMPLCNPCDLCTAKNRNEGGHVAADDEECDDCGYNARVAWEYEQLREGLTVGVVMQGEAIQMSIQDLAAAMVATVGHDFEWLPATPLFAMVEVYKLAEPHEMPHRMEIGTALHEAVERFTIDASPRDTSNDPPWKWAGEDDGIR